MGSEATDRQIWWRVFVPLAVICAAWALAVPLMTGPDEGDQTIRAAAVARGELVGEPTEQWGNLIVEVQVPEAFATADSICFLGPLHRDFVLEPAPLSPDCDSMTGDSHLVDAETYEHRNQPLYFFAVGLPSLLFPNETGAYLMRAVSIVLCGALLASGLVSLRRLAPRYPLVVLGAGVALTPTVLYLTATVNSMGLEIAGSFCLWATGLAIVRGSPDDEVAEIDGRLVRRFGLALVILVLARGGSPGFAAVILGSLALLAGRERLRALWGRRDVRRWLLGPTAGATALSVGWVLYIHAEYPLDHRSGSGLSYALSELGWFSREMVGVFGATDVVPPLAVPLLWLAAIVVVVVLGLRQGGRGDLVLALLLGAAGLGILLSGEGFSVPQTGYYWQGRYVMPLMVGAVLVAGASGRPAASPAAMRGRLRQAAAVLPLLLVCQIWSLLYAVRHYSVGYAGPRDPVEFLFDPVWSPPVVPSAVLVVFAVGGFVALGLAFVRGLDRGPTSTDATIVGTDRELSAVGAT